MSPTLDRWPLVSVITPAYNCADLISDTVQSVLAQTFPSWEYIIVDDASTDNTSDVIRDFTKSDSRIVLLTQTENGGPGAARNRGIEQARGRYIAFVDSDDLWFPNKLEKQLAFMRRTGAGLSYTNYERIDEESGKVIGYVKGPDRLTESDFMYSNQIACSTAMYDAALTGRFLMPVIRKRQDWGLWLQLTRLGFVGMNVGETLVRYRVRSNSVSSNKVAALLYTWLFFRDVANIPFHNRLYHLMYYAAFNAKKYRVAAKRAKRAN